MEALELLEVIENGVSDQVLFNDTFSGVRNLLVDIMALSNSKGGVIIIGIDGVTGEILGINNEVIKKI